MLRGKSDGDGCGRIRRKGIPKQTWMDSVNADLRENGLSGEDTQNRAKWRQLARNIDPA